MKGYLYILESKKNGRYYVGSSFNPQKRLNEFHNEGKVMSTKHLRPLVIVFTQEYCCIRQARIVEHRLKKLKSRKVLEDMIRSGKCCMV